MQIAHFLSRRSVNRISSPSFVAKPSAFCPLTQTSTFRQDRFHFSRILRQARTKSFLSESKNLLSSFMLALSKVNRQWRPKDSLRCQVAAQSSQSRSLCINVLNQPITSEFSSKFTLHSKFSINHTCGRPSSLDSLFSSSFSSWRGGDSSAKGI